MSPQHHSPEAEPYPDYSAFEFDDDPSLIPSTETPPPGQAQGLNEYEHGYGYGYGRYEESVAGGGESGRPVRETRSGGGVGGGIPSSGGLPPGAAAVSTGVGGYSHYQQPEPEYYQDNQDSDYYNHLAVRGPSLGDYPSSGFVHQQPSASFPSGADRSTPATGFTTSSSSSGAPLPPTKDKVLQNSSSPASSRSKSSSVRSGGSVSYPKNYHSHQMAVPSPPMSSNVYVSPSTKDSPLPPPPRLPSANTIPPADSYPRSQSQTFDRPPRDYPQYQQQHHHPQLPPPPQVFPTASSHLEDPGDYSEGETPGLAEELRHSRTDSLGASSFFGGLDGTSGRRTVAGGDGGAGAGYDSEGEEHILNGTGGSSGVDGGGGGGRGRYDSTATMMTTATGMTNLSLGTEPSLMDRGRPGAPRGTDEDEIRQPRPINVASRPSSFYGLERQGDDIVPPASATSTTFAGAAAAAGPAAATAGDSTRDQGHFRRPSASASAHDLRTTYTDAQRRQMDQAERIRAYRQGLPQQSISGISAVLPPGATPPGMPGGSGSGSASPALQVNSLPPGAQNRVAEPSPTPSSSSHSGNTPALPPASGAGMSTREHQQHIRSRTSSFGTYGRSVSEGGGSRSRATSFFGMDGGAGLPPLPNGAIPAPGTRQSVAMSVYGNSLGIGDASLFAQPPAPLLDHSHLHPGVQAKLLDYDSTLELYRQNTKKTNDPGVNFEFCIFLLEVVKELDPDNPNASLVARPDSRPGETGPMDKRMKDPEKIKEKRAALIQESVQMLNKLASRGHAQSQYMLADLYAQGVGTVKGKQDYDKAYPLFVLAAKHGHSEACFRSGQCCENGWGSRKDMTKAVQFYRKAAALSHPTAMYRLGLAEINGELHLSKQPRDGVKWLKRAAELADSTNPPQPQSLHDLGLLHERGIPNVVFVDNEYAAELFARAAELGWSPSAYKLGLCYEYGKMDCPQDPALSIHYYNIAAQQGHAEACLALTAWYLVGSSGVLPQSDTEAYLWARKAAEKGLAKAQFACGYFTETGTGTPRDQSDAIKWYKKAAENGEKRAIQRLRQQGVQVNEAASSPPPDRTTKEDVLDGPSHSGDNKIKKGKNKGGRKLLDMLSS